MKEGGGGNNSTVIEAIGGALNIVAMTGNKLRSIYVLLLSV